MGGSNLLGSPPAPHQYLIIYNGSDWGGILEGLQTKQAISSSSTLGCGKDAQSLHSNTKPILTKQRVKEWDYCGTLHFTP
jgi:hypothetical protein